MSSRLIPIVFAGAMGVLAGVSMTTSVGAGEVVGSPTPDSGNCYPFSCNDSGTSVGLSIDYDEIYTQTAFSGVTTIDKITFFDAARAGLTGFPTPVVLSGDYVIIFGTTTSPVGSGYPVAPLSNIETFFNGPLGGQTGTFSVSGTPYVYNPANGNLVMEIEVFNQTDVPNNHGNGYYEQDSTTNTISRAYFISNGTTAFGGDALVTGFNNVPEPASWALMLAGFAGLGAVLRTRRRAMAAA